MKKTFKERVRNAREAFFEGEHYAPAPMIVRENDFDLQNHAADSDEDVSFEKLSFDGWAFAKCLFFYLPGVALLYFVTLFLTLVASTQIEDARHFSFAFFWLGFGTFLIMFGIGKLENLKYLKVVAAVLIASFAVGLPSLFVPIEARGEFFIDYSLYFLPVVAFIGYFVKKQLDEETIKLL